MVFLSFHSLNLLQSIIKATEKFRSDYIYIIFTDSEDSKMKNKGSNLKVDRLRTDMMGTIEDTKHPEDIELDALTLVLGYREKRYVLLKSWKRLIVQNNCK